METKTIVKSPQISLNLSKLVNNEISIYNGELTAQAFVKATIRITKSFPQLPKDFFEILKNRLFENDFNDNRLIDAVNHVIDTCIYPVPTIANIISYDKKIKLLTYAELVKENDLFKGIAEHYIAVKITGTDYPMFAKKEDFEKYNLIKFSPEKKQ
jgi:hypothetical protein